MTTVFFWNVNFKIYFCWKQIKVIVYLFWHKLSQLLPCGWALPAFDIWIKLNKSFFPQLFEFFIIITPSPQSFREKHQESSGNFIRYDYQKICEWTRRNDINGNHKKIIFIEMVIQSIICKFLKGFTCYPQKNVTAVTAVVYSSRPFRNILKFRSHRWDLPTVWKTRFYQIHIEKFS